MPGRILIVDDVATNRIVLKVKLASASYDVQLAERTETALAAIEAHPPALIVLSDRLGGPVAVTEIARRLRGTPATSAIMMIAICRTPGQDRRIALLQAGIDEIVEEPVDEAGLLAHVRRLLRRQSEEASTHVAALGLAEAPAVFEQTGLVWLVGDDPRRTAEIERALAGRLRHRCLCIPSGQVLDRMRNGPAPDLFLVVADQPERAELRLLAELRARTPRADAEIALMGGGAGCEALAMALDLGACDAVAMTVGIDELALRLQRRIAAKHERDRRRRELERGLMLALTDPLTGLDNRRAAFSRLAALAEAGRAAGQPLALMILDIDRFKAINDRHGHFAGDRVLVEVAHRLRQNLREVDLLARIGGEEFLVALPGTPLVPARLSAERLRRAVEADPVPLPGAGEVFVTLSIGLGMGPGPDETIEQALARADGALYAAKARGRNMVTISQSVA